MFLFNPVECGEKTKKKACKNCTCGLAEELENENPKPEKKTENAKSSCGSVSCFYGIPCKNLECAVCSLGCMNSD